MEKKQKQYFNWVLRLQSSGLKFTTTFYINRPLCVTFPLKSKELKSQEVHWITRKFLSDPSTKPRAGLVLKFPKMKWPGFTSIIKVSHLLSLQEQKIWLVRIKANLTQNIRRYVVLYKQHSTLQQNIVGKIFWENMSQVVLWKLF